jgi:hypothetical protein
LKTTKTLKVVTIVNGCPWLLNAVMAVGKRNIAAKNALMHIMKNTIVRKKNSKRMRAAFFERLNVDELKKHFAQGGDPNEFVEQEPDHWYAPALHWVYPNVACMRVLLEAGADPNGQDCEGRRDGEDYLITRAIEIRLIPVLCLLIEFGALKNHHAQDAAMAMAEKQNDREMILFLMRKGAGATPWSSEYVQKLETARWACKLSCNATMRALKLQGSLHKDIIPLVVRTTWDMRFQDQWVESVPPWFSLNI